MQNGIDDSLLETVRYLGAELGQIIQQHLGDEWLEKIETIRKQGRKSCSGDKSSTEKLQSMFAEMPDESLLTVGRAFSQFLNLANIAEQEHTVAHLSEQDPVDEFLKRVHSIDNSEMSLEEAISKLQIELVLTAHPTEVTRRTLIFKYSRLAECLSELHADNLTENQRHQIEQRIAELISQAWHTDEIRAARPTPVDEAQWGFSVIENSLWEAVPSFIRKLDGQLSHEYQISLPTDAVPVRFASWMGGDRDGNPFVTSKVTEEVLLRARKRSAALFKGDIQNLVVELSMTKCDKALQDEVGEDCREPYRAVLKGLLDKLVATVEGIETYLAGQTTVSQDGWIKTQDELIKPLQLCYDSLLNSGMSVIAQGQLLDTIRRAHCFGIHLLKLDIRQDSDRHDQVFSEITRYLGLGDYSEWSEQDKQAFLLRELGSKRPLIPRVWSPSEEVQEVLDTCKVVAQQSKDALGIYIISMARRPSDVLEVHLLLQEHGIKWPMPVAPLFETLDDLNNAYDSMAQLMAIDWYRGFIQNHQYVMIGYSDSAKDAGALAAGWAQYQAQEALVGLAEKYQVKLTLFHGRGGTIGRGGLPAHSAILSQPPGSCLGGLRVTEQGETIRYKFGTQPLAERSFSLYASAILESLMLPPPAPKQEWRDIMTEMGAEARDNYRAVVRHDENFVAYFRSATPELELSKLPLGSRPSKRKPNGGVESLRAIPWIFAWAQNRLVLPSWLGVMKAFKVSIDNGNEPTMKEMMKEWPFFASRLSMLEMVFMKANLQIAALYDESLVPEELKYFGQNLREELTESQKLLLKIIDRETVMESDPAGRESMQIRAHYLEPLHLLQIELLKRARERGDDLEYTMERALMVSIAGVATGLRNTG
ncbi:phosphoenolpyruvate carboxylase [Gayadomonas joobiniege]|uniref:phosphoenolpyruvate carboxylase n=1 Tax=Gayadomonas joobiniege TaxID=1234606 RepID=UPI00036A9F78|nr:phosphoenolpyruvate carboxylase [Gayadomonas joobiniege]